MTEVKILRFTEPNDGVMEIAIKKQINDGWELKAFTQAGRYGDYFSAVFTRDTSDSRIKEVPE